MISDKELKKLNRQFANRVGVNQYGEPLYKWEFLPRLTHLRRKQGDDDWDLYKPKGTNGIWVPSANAVEVQSYRRLGERWAVVKHEFIDQDKWAQLFGAQAIWPARGSYHPTDAVLIPGVEPSQSLTERMIEMINQTRNKSVASYEAKVEAELEQEERFSFDTLYAMIEDTMTAFGADPGKRSGGVSIFSDGRAQGAH